MFLLLLTLFSVQSADAEELAPTPQALTRIYIDQDAKTFTFVIDGEPAAVLNKSGLHVPGDINYDGVLTDKGGDTLRDASKSDTKEAVDE